MDTKIPDSKLEYGEVNKLLSELLITEDLLQYRFVKTLMRLCKYEDITEYLKTL